MKGEQGEKQREGGNEETAGEDPKERNLKGGVKRDATEGHRGEKRGINKRLGIEREKRQIREDRC